MPAKLAVLIPTYNGGALLERTVGSCAIAGLDPDRYTIVVVDNASSDGSVEQLPSRTASGAEVRVVRNPTNIGRVANWNRALELADPAEFTYATFLFTGDCWLPGGGSLLRLLTQMEAVDAVMGMTPYVIEDAAGRAVRQARQMILPNPVTMIHAAEVLRQAIGVGAMVFGPLQATVYRLYPSARLQFDPAQPSHTDQEATIHFLNQHPGTVVMSADPFTAWRAHSGRFHMSMDPIKQLADDIAVLERTSALTGYPVHWEEAHSRLMLRYAFAARRKPRLVFDVIRTLYKRKHGVSLARIIQIAFSAATSGGSMVRFT